MSRRGVKTASGLIVVITFRVLSARTRNVTAISFLATSCLSSALSLLAALPASADFASSALFGSLLLVALADGSAG